jgi:hypothetical protein
VVAVPFSKELDDAVAAGPPIAAMPHIQAFTQQPAFILRQLRLT